MRRDNAAFEVHIRKWLSISIFLTGTLLFNLSVVAQQPLEPVRKIDDRALKIIEGSTYCSAGYGLHSIQVQVEGERAYDEEQGTPYLPISGLSDVPALTLGCSINRIVIDWIFLDDAIRLNQALTYQNVDYNTLSVRHNALTIGYTFPIIAHVFRWDLGIGYSMTQYSLGYYDGVNSANDRELPNLKSGGALLHSNLKVYLSPNLFVHWTSQSALGNSNLVNYYSQVGLSFLVKL